MNLNKELEWNKMSNVENIKNKMKSINKPTATEALLSTPEVSENETAASQEKEKNRDLASIKTNAFSKEKKNKPAKKLKGIYLDEDVLEIYEQEADKRDRGWGSQLVTDLLRAVFEEEGLMDKSK